jgi:hypothetical protein
VRTPSVDAPASITFDNVYVAGTVVPGIDWYIIVTGDELTENDLREMATGGGAWTTAGGVYTGLTNNQMRDLAGFDGMPYAVRVLSIQGPAQIDGPGLAPGPGLGDTFTFAYGQATFVDPVTGNVIVDPIQRLDDVRVGISVRMASTLITGNWEGAIYGHGVVTISHGGRTVVLNDGSSVMVIDGAPVQLDTAVTRIDGRLFLPLRALFEAFYWDVNADNFPSITVTR